MTQLHNNQTTIGSPFLQALIDIAPRIGLTVRLVIPPVFRHRKTLWVEDQTRLNKDEILTPVVKELPDKGSKNKHCRGQCLLCGSFVNLAALHVQVTFSPKKNMFETSMKRLAG